MFSESNSNFQNESESYVVQNTRKISTHWKGQYSFVIYISHAPYAFIETFLVLMYGNGDRSAYILWSAYFTAYHMFRGGGPAELKIKRNISWIVPVN